MSKIDEAFYASINRHIAQIDGDMASYEQLKDCFLEAAAENQGVPRKTVALLIEHMTNRDVAEEMMQEIEAHSVSPIAASARRH